MSAQTIEKKVKKPKTLAAKPADAPAAAAIAPAAEQIIVKKEKKSKKLAAAEESSQAAAEAPAAASQVDASAAQEDGASKEEDSSNDEKLSRKKRTYVQLVAEVDHLNSVVDQYIVDHRDPKNTEMNRFLKSVEKGLRKVRVHVQKIGKNRSNTPSAPGVQSGFQKPVRISDAVAQFTGWNAAEPRARVEVTNFVCDYIKQHNLQSPEDRRVILADQRLTQLLDYQNDRDGNLTYATIQKLLAKHYTPLSA